MGISAVKNTAIVAEVIDNNSPKKGEVAPPLSLSTSNTRSLVDVAKDIDRHKKTRSVAAERMEKFDIKIRELENQKGIWQDEIDKATDQMKPLEEEIKALMS